MAHIPETLMARHFISRFALRTRWMTWQEAWHVSAGGDPVAKRFGLERSRGIRETAARKGFIEQESSRVSQARNYYERSLAMYRETVGDRTVEVAEVLGALSTSFAWTDDSAKAEQLAREAIAIFEVTVPPMHPDRISAENKAR
jgi:hypothetical protein